MSICASTMKLLMAQNICEILKACQQQQDFKFHQVSSPGKASLPLCLEAGIALCIQKRLDKCINTEFVAEN